MKKIILTGFRPFGPYEYNPTAELAKFYNGKTITGNEIIIGVVLPCTYYGAFNLLSKIIDYENPYAIISTGLWSSVKGIRIETTFKNLMDGKYPDSNGYDPKNIPLNSEQGAKGKYKSFSDSLYLEKKLQRLDIPIEVSEDANTFICNSLAYLTNQKIAKEKLQIKNCFIHVPWTDDYQEKIELEEGKTFLNKEKLYDAVEILIQNI